MLKVPAKYRILEKLGEGGMGEVYKAEDTILRRLVAIKMISTHGRRDQAAQARFLREAQAASSISHPCIATIYEMGETEDGAYIAMEYIEGSNLREHLRKGTLDNRTILDITVQICSALEEAHTGSVLHRDIKPENILITKRKRVKIVDFGLAKWLAPPLNDGETLAHRLSHSGAIIGTPAYMAPEQIRGEELDSRADLFAVGVVLHEMILGRLPFTGASALEMAASVLRDPVRPNIEHTSGAKRKLAEVAERCLEKDRERRFKSASELREVLEKLRTDMDTLNEQDRRFVSRASEFYSMPATPTVLVMPFDAVGGDADSAVFAIGITHALLTDLSSIPGVSVLSKSYPGTTHSKSTPAQSAMELGATLLMEGEVLRGGNTIGVMARLSDVASGRILWGSRYRAQVTDLFEIQDEVCRNVASALKLKLSTDIRDRITRPPTRSIDAFDAYAQGRALLERRDIKENITASIDKFEMAIRQDPNFALAYAALGEACWRRYQDSHDASWVQRAVSACDHALILDPNQSLVHVSLGIIYHGTGRTDVAIEELERAVALQPASDTAHNWLGLCWQRKGDLAKAVSFFEKAISIRPYWGHHEELGKCYYEFGKYQEAVEQFRHVISLQPDNYEGYNNLGAMYYMLGNYPDAVSILERANEIYPNKESLSNLGSACFYLGQYDRAIKHFQDALAFDPASDICHRNLGDAYQRSGNQAMAIAEYEAACNLLYQAIQVNPSDGELHSRLAVCEAKLGRHKNALKSIETASQNSPNHTIVLYDRAIVMALAGESASAIECLKVALERGYSRSEIEKDPDLEPLRSDPEYSELMKSTPRPKPRV